MKSNIHIETPDGEVVDSKALNKDSNPAGESGITNDANDNAAGPKVNPDPRANGNIPEKDKQEKSKGSGTEITDGEAG